MELLESGGYQILVLPLGTPLRALESQLDAALAISLCEQLLEGVCALGFETLGSDTILTGFRGTTTWVTPEVGKLTIPVDLWATGSIMFCFFGASLPAGH
ncbi:hypothetical protein BT69DRAFT_1280434 [Atractiella rhizophila]|nr:hypothetical protein BT69DRAFT_1280434 [Atractiella rhizophila]